MDGAEVVSVEPDGDDKVLVTIKAPDDEGDWASSSLTIGDATVYSPLTSATASATVQSTRQDGDDLVADIVLVANVGSIASEVPVDAISFEAELADATVDSVTVNEDSTATVVARIAGIGSQVDDFCLTGQIVIAEGVLLQTWGEPAPGDGIPVEHELVEEGKSKEKEDGYQNPLENYDPDESSNNYDDNNSNNNNEDSFEFSKDGDGGGNADGGGGGNAGPSNDGRNAINRDSAVKLGDIDGLTKLLDDSFADGDKEVFVPIKDANNKIQNVRFNEDDFGRLSRISANKRHEVANAAAASTEARLNKALDREATRIQYDQIGKGFSAASKLMGYFSPAASQSIQGVGGIVYGVGIVRDRQLWRHV